MRVAHAHIPIDLSGTSPPRRCVYVMQTTAMTELLSILIVGGLRCLLELAKPGLKVGFDIGAQNDLRNGHTQKANKVGHSHLGFDV